MPIIPENAGDEKSLKDAEPENRTLPLADDKGRKMVAEPRRRHRLRTLALLALAVCALAGALLYWLHSRHYESTDDAFIAGHVTQVSARISGRVADVLVKDNQLVHQDDVLVRIDPSDYKAKRDQAQAALDAAKTNLDETVAQQAAARATAEQSQAQVVSAEASAANAEKERKRYDTLFAQRVVSQEARDNADTTARTASSNLDAARKKFATDQAQVALAGARIETAKAHVGQARAAEEQTALDLAHTVVHARVTGRVTNKSVEPGDYLQPGQSFMSLVQPDVWVVANFKETALTHMRPGQPVDIKVDAYPDIDFHGHVDSIQRGTGSAFSLLPPENATGNYVKVVQRVPVKIVLDRTPSHEDRILAPGMSVVPTVRVR